MSKVESPSGDHLKIGPNNERVVESDVPARQGVTGHNVRIVLFVSVVAAAVALAAVYAFVIR